MAFLNMLLFTVLLLEQFLPQYCSTPIQSHSGPHICRSRAGDPPCCPGWKQRDHDQLCLSPICSKGCGKYGTCIAPNVCQCQSGVTAPVCSLKIGESENFCKNYGCHHLCHIESGYPMCSCMAGFRLHEDFKTCVGPSNQHGSKSLADKAILKELDEEFQTSHLCPLGYVYNSVLGFCSDINECEGIKDLACEHICINMLGTYRCSCFQGYSLRPDKHSCLKKKLHRDTCIPNCVNGGSCADGKCLCRAGLHGDACEKDVNECLELNNVCEYKCRNNFGSFRCSCPPGSVLNADFQTCRAMSCVPECTNSGTCVNGKCICAPGFKGKSCGTDRNECKDGLASCQYMCRNTHGSYVCLCPPRSWLKSDGHSCTYTKLCLHKCRNGGTCVTGKCKCPPGLTGLTCRSDINECSHGTNGCSHGCYNTYGSFRCYCPRKMILSAEGRFCVSSDARKSKSTVETAKGKIRPVQCFPSCSSLHTCIDGKCKCLQSSGCSTTTTTTTRSSEADPAVEKLTISDRQIPSSYFPSIGSSTSTFSPFAYSQRPPEKKLNSKSFSVDIDGKELDMEKVSSEILMNLEEMQKTNESHSNVDVAHNTKSDEDLKNNEEPAGGFVLAVNKNIVRSMMNDFKSRRRVNGKKHSRSEIRISAASDIPCNYMGSWYNSGVVFSPDRHNCTRCKCQNGVLRCTKQVCPTLACPNPVRGPCCDRCPDDCVFDMKIRRNGDNFSPRNDPCKTCYCSAGLVTCTDAPCPILDCPVKSQFLPPGRCCAECLIVKKTVSKTSRNIKGCRHRNILYDIGENWVDSGDKCTVCECQDRESVECFSLECHKDLCDNGLVKGCCSVCNECHLDGVRMSNGDVKKRNVKGVCEECKCRFGDLKCRFKPCQKNNCQIRIGKKLFSYNHGDIFNLPNDPCVKCSCASGAMSCFAVECDASCLHDTKNATDCCSSCKDT